MPTPARVRKRHKLHPLNRLLAAFAVLVVFGGAGLSLYVDNFNAEKYRAQIVAALSERTSRRISFDGPIKPVLSWNGAALRIHDVEIGNPPWASRPVMAKIGRVDLVVSLVALLQGRLVITGLGLTDADIVLEAENGGRDNWTFTPLRGHAKITQAEAEDKTRPVSVRIGKLAVTTADVTFYNRDGEASFYKLAHLLVDNEGGAALHLEAFYDDTPVTLNLQAGTDTLLDPGGTWPFSADVTIDNAKLTAEGNIDLDAHKAEVNLYEIRSAGSNLYGDFAVDWSGATPILHGSLMGGSLAPYDFPFASAAGGAPARRHGRAFSDTPLGLDSLKTVTATFGVRISRIDLPGLSFAKTAATVKLDKGFLAIDPISALLEGGTVDAKINVDGAASPYQASVTVAAANVPLDDVMHFLGAPSFLSGRTDLDVNLGGSGDTMHSLAANTFGIFTIAARGGNVSNSLVHNISSAFLALFAPAGVSDLNCLAARFIVKHGVAETNGMLIDTGAATIAGRGDIDLGAENFNILLHAKAKSISVSGQILPAGYLGGTLLEPRFSIDPVEVVQNVTGYVFNGASNANVPQMLSAPGENACVYTLEHPTPQTEDVTRPGFLNRATDSIEGITGTIKSLLGH